LRSSPPPGAAGRQRPTACSLFLTSKSSPGPVRPEALADGFMTAFEGAFILSKSLNQADITVRQLRLYSTTIEALFLPE
jgi:hypothetical protein